MFCCSFCFNTLWAVYSLESLSFFMMCCQFYFKLIQNEKAQPCLINSMIFHRRLNHWFFFAFTWYGLRGSFLGWGRFNFVRSFVYYLWFVWLIEWKRKDFSMNAATTAVRFERLSNSMECVKWFQVLYITLLSHHFQLLYMYITKIHI